MFDFQFLQHFGNCHGEMTTIAGVVTALAGGSAGIAIFRNKLAKVPLLGRIFKVKHDCCEHTPADEEPKVERCASCEQVTFEHLCDCMDGGSSMNSREEPCCVCNKFIMCTSCRCPACNPVGV